MCAKQVLGTFSLLVGLSLWSTNGAFAQGAEIAHPKRAVDVVFIVDCSSSMEQEMGHVRDGVFTFLTNANAQPNLDLRFAIILLGRRPEMIQDFADAETTATTFDCLRNVPGYHRRHPDREPGLEAIRMVLGAAGMNQFDYEYCLRNGGCVNSNGFVQFRRDVDQKLLLLITDEDSDRAYYPENRIPGQIRGNPPAHWKASFAAWQLEIDHTALAVAGDPRVSLNLLVDPDRGQTRSQYGDPVADRCTGPGLLGYDPKETAAALRTMNGGLSAHCLQSQVMARGGFARSFDVTRLGEPGMVEDVFAAKFEELCSTCQPCTGWRIIGEGTPGVNGEVPVLSISGEPALCKTICFMVGNRSGAPTAGLLILSTGRFEPALRFAGGTIYPAFPNAPHVILPVPMPGGMTGLVGPIPCELPGLPCYIVYAQVGVLDLAPTHGNRVWPTIAWTPGIELAIGR